MYKTIYSLAKRNIKKYKKHYFIASIVVLIVSTIMFSYIITNENNYELLRKYNEKKYGSWYVRIENIDDFSIEKLQSIFDDMDEKYKTELRYGYIKNQGYFKNYQLAHIDDSIYDLCKIDIIDGRKPSQNNEILVSDKFTKIENLKVDDKLIYNGQSFIITGIFQTYNDDLPDILTCFNNYESLDYYANMELPKNGEIVCYDENGDWYKFVLNYQKSPFGYDHFEFNKNVNDAMKYIYFYTEITIIVFFILFLLTSSSLKKRVKEMSLLRGIGMTVYQMIQMITIENIIICTLSIFIGLIISISLSYVFMYFQSLIYHEFVYSINLSILFLTGFILICCMFVSSIIPIILSSRHALSGSFDSYKFKYIQVRYRKLKKQSLSYLSMRELFVNKKMNLCFLIFILMFSFYVIVGFYDGHTIKINSFQRQDEKKYVEIYLNDEKQAKFFKDNLKGDTLIFPYIYTDGNNSIEFQNIKGTINQFGIVENNGFINKQDIKGHLPTKSNEILVGKTINAMTLSIKDNPNMDIQMNNVSINNVDYYINGYEENENKMISVTVEINSPDIGEKILINGEEFTVTGMIDNENESSSASSMIFLYQDDYYRLMNDYTKNYYGIHYFEKDDYTFVNNFLRRHYLEEQYYTNMNELGDFDDFEVDLGFLITILLIGFVLILFLNYNNIENNYQDYQMYHILGMSYQKIKRKQLWKSYHMFFISFVFIILYFIILMIFCVNHYCPLLRLLGLLVIIFIVYIIVYNLPLYLVMKNHKNEELRNGDE